MSLRAAGRRCADGASGLFDRPSLTLTDGAGGFLPGVPLCLDCLGMGTRITGGPGPSSKENRPLLKREPEGPGSARSRLSFRC